MAPTPTQLNSETQDNTPAKTTSSVNHPDTELKLFDETFEYILEDIRSLQGIDTNAEPNENCQTELDDATNYVQTCMKYNVPHGKKLRGRMVVMVYQSLVPNATAENVKLARILGWCAEMLQAAYLVADDIMDNAETRRGQPCWYRLANNGTNALNDSFLLEHLSYQILEKYFGELECYTELLNLLLSVTYKTILGQSMDIRASQDRDFSKYTVQLYNSIVTYKTGYYTVYLPVALGMAFAGIGNRNNENKNKEIWKKMEQVTLDIGRLFQIQDDYFDCFGDEEVIGKKVGTDIEEGKCTWLFVKAKEVTVDGKTLDLLDNNYGSTDKDKVNTVKGIYKKLLLPQVFGMHQEKIYGDINRRIEQLGNKELEKVVTMFLKMIYKRAF